MQKYNKNMIHKNFSRKYFGKRAKKPQNVLSLYSGIIRFGQKKRGERVLTER